MEKLITIYNTEYAIPAVFSYSQKHEKMPAVILCHGTGSQKNEVGNLFAEMSKRLLNIGIASIRLDYAGCGDSKACQTFINTIGFRKGFDHFEQQFLAPLTPLTQK